MNSMIQNYLFIDGNYLRRAYEDSMRKFFSDVDARYLSLAKIRDELQASKGFYYDSVDETSPDQGAKQKDWLDLVRSLPGFHVRQGTISARKRQKQVDVQLAVDMLTHAFNKNIWHASLIAGDLDFKPLVDALINLGVHVHVYYEPRSGSRLLYHAADVAVPMTLQSFWNWSTDQYQRAHAIPVIDKTEYGPEEHPAGVHTLDLKGTWNDRPVRLYGIANHTAWALYVPRHHEDGPMTVRHLEKERLLQYFSLVYGGKISWDE